VVDLSTGTRKRLLEGSDPHYLSSGYLLLTRAGRPHVAPFDLTRLEVTGPAAPVSEDLAVAVVQGRGAMAVAENGTVAYVRPTATSGRLVFVAANGSVRSAAAEPGRFGHPRFSPDGARFVTSSLGDLRVYDIERGTYMQLTIDAAVSRPIWSADGRNIAFNRGGSIFTIPADDSGPPVLVLQGEPTAAVYPLAWSRDGRTLVYSRPDPISRDVYVLPAGGKPTPFLSSAKDERSAMLSPGGDWMVYSVLDGGREDVYLNPYPGPGGRVPVSTDGGREPVWSGDEIFYRSADGQRMMAVTVQTKPTLSIGRPREVFRGQYRLGSFWSQYDVHPRTKEFLMIAVDGPIEPSLVVAVNWLELPQK
jgi:hypothetical protein